MQSSTATRIDVEQRLPPTIWYMGAKSRVLPDFLDRVLDEEVPEGGTVLDLFSGTGIVSAWCAGRYRVVANDVQRYAQVIAGSFIEHRPADRDAFLAGLDANQDLREKTSNNLKALEEAYEPALAEETEHLHRVLNHQGPEPLEKYRRFLNLPGLLYGDPRPPAAIYAGAAGLVSGEAVERRRKDPRCRPYCLMTAYYANVYYGLCQALGLDSIRAAIDALDPEAPFAAARRTHYLSALLHAASVSTSGTSHFAQPRHLHKDSELRAMARRRILKVWETFKEYSEAIRQAVASTEYREGNRALCGDYRSLIEENGSGEKFIEAVRGDLVYMDPPYTADNYSRFYHVLEVLADYDYPELDQNGGGEVLRGRYPVLGGRFLSGFCQKGEVEEEFRRVIRAAAGSGSKLVISYGSPNGLLLKVYHRQEPQADPIRRLEDLCRQSYREVKTLRRHLLHSGQGDKNKPTDELLVVCAGPRAGV